jgi:hypothetical protein
MLTYRARLEAERQLAHPCVVGEFVGDEMSETSPRRSTPGSIGSIGSIAAP